MGRGNVFSTILGEGRPDRTWLLPLFPAGLNLAGVVLLAMSWGAIRPWAAPFLLLTIVPLLGSMLALRTRRYGPAALLAAIAIPASLLAAFISLFWILYTVWCCIGSPLLLLTSTLSMALLLTSGLASLAVARASIEAQRRDAVIRVEEDDD